MKPILIVSDKFETARVYAQMAALEPSKWKYAMNRASFYGVRDVIIIKCGLYFHNVNWSEINEAIRELRAKTTVQEVYMK